MSIHQTNSPILLTTRGNIFHIALLVFCMLWAIAPLYIFGPAIIDDAYITFRYADNIAAGKGFVFNVEDGPLLGTSTPLFTLLLALGRLAGISCPSMALGLSVIGATAAYFFGILLFFNKWGINGFLEGEHRAAQTGNLYYYAGIAWALILGTLPEWIFVQQSGMETMFFVGISVAALWAAMTDRVKLAAILGSLALLTRYDGIALAAIVMAWIIWRRCFLGYRGGARTPLTGLTRKSDRKPLTGLTRDNKETPLTGLASGKCIGAWVSVALFTVIQLPWIIYALVAFGSYWPQSVAAKHIIHTRTLWGNLAAHLHYFSIGLHGMVGSFLHLHLLPFFLLGFVLLVWRRHRSLLLLLWGVASVLGFSYSRIMLQGWYMMPALFVFSWVAVWGLWTIFDSENWETGKLSLQQATGSNGTLEQKRSSSHLFRILPLAICVALLIPQLRFVLADRSGWPQMRIVRERAYFRAAEMIRQQGNPGQSVLVGEVGVFAYALPDFRIIDSSGINSRMVYETRMADVQRMEMEKIPNQSIDLGTEFWVKDVINQAKPDFIASLDVILHLDKLRKDPDFQRSYELIDEIRVMPPRVPRSPVVYIYQRESNIR